MKNTYDTELLGFQENLFTEACNSLEKTGQAALHIFTSGGKSYIAKKIIEYTNMHKGNASVLWISTKSAVNNVSTCVFETSGLKNKIDYCTYSFFSRNPEMAACMLSGKGYNLIILDEAHRALADKTEIGVKILLESYKGEWIVSMSATPNRLTDNRNAFDVLTPNAIYSKFDLDKAISNNLIPMINYYILNLSLLKSDYTEIDRLSSMSAVFKSLEPEIESMKAFILNYKFDMIKGSTELITKTNVYNASNGDRFIVFFPKISELDRMQSSIKKIFKASYGKGIEINLLKYHSKMDKEEAEKNFNIIMGEPKSNRVDIMLTVDMGSESIHPKNIRGILMFRGTKSERIYKQQLGRAIKLKTEANSDVILVYDFMDNFSLLGENKTNKELQGRKRSENRVITMEELRAKIARCVEAENNISIEAANLEIQDFIEKISVFNEEQKSIEYLKEIALIIQNEQGDKEYINIFDYLCEKTKYIQNWELIKKWYTNTQKEFCDYSCDDKCSEFVVRMLNDLDITAYVNNYTKANEIRNMLELRGISEELSKIAFDYTRLSEIEGLANRINKYRSMFIKNKMTMSEQLYAIRHGIDIKLEHSDKDKTFVCSATEDIELIESIQQLKDAYSNNNVSRTRFTGMLCAWKNDEKIRKNNRGVLRSVETDFLEKTRTSSEIYAKDRKIGDCLMQALNKIKYKESISNSDNNILLKLSPSYIIDNNFEYSMGVFDYYKISLESKDFLGKVLRYTKFCEYYMDVINRKSTESLNKLNEYDINNLSSIARQLLDSQKFKDAKGKITGATQTKEIRSIVKGFNTYREEDAKKLIDAIKRKHASEVEILAYAFPDEKCEESISYLLGMPFAEENTLKKSVMKDGESTKHILNNLMLLDIFSSGVINRLKKLYA